MDRIAHKVEIPLPPAEVFKALNDAKALGALMPGVAGTTGETTRPKRLAMGAQFELMTSKGEAVSATVIEHVPNRSCAIEDAKGVRSRWVCVPMKDGRTLLTNEILGHFGPDKAAKLETETVDRMTEFVAARLASRKR